MAVQKNTEIRQKASENNVCLWEIAYELGINDGNFSRRLRKEFAPDEKEKILTIIDKIVSERGDK